MKYVFAAMWVLHLGVYFFLVAKGRTIDPWLMTNTAIFWVSYTIMNHIDRKLK